METLKNLKQAKNDIIEILKDGIIWDMEQQVIEASEGHEALALELLQEARRQGEGNILKELEKIKLNEMAHYTIN